MKTKDFWQQKLVQVLHDPPHKPYTLRGIEGGHKGVSKRVFSALTSGELKWVVLRPDLAASGADRPVLNRPRRTPGKGTQPQVNYAKPEEAVITHPLCATRLQLPDLRGVHASPKVLDELAFSEDPNLEQEDATSPEDGPNPLELPEAIESGIARVEDLLRERQANLSDVAELQGAFHYLWRGLRSDLAEGDAAAAFLYERLPGESRTPDHSIWEHTRITSALGFMGTRKLEPAQEPYLLTFSIGPIQDFISEARKGRDLWISSFLLADLIFHAMKPLITQYGPDAVVYPDLRGNARVDNWLFEEQRDCMPREVQTQPTTHAALLPGMFVAIVPRGAESSEHLRPLESIARQCEAALTERWKKLADVVRDWLRKKREGEAGASWEKIYERQHATPPIKAMWTAVHWKAPEKIAAADVEKLGYGRGLPCQREEDQPKVAQATKNAEADRQARLDMWLPRDARAHYENARLTFARVNLGYLQNERGFDYALTHHQLQVRHKLRKEAARGVRPDAEEPGEKCTLCGKRQALYEHDDLRRVGSQREATRTFWRGLDEERKGEERLCGICALKRYLVEADVKGIFNKTWDAEGAQSGNASERFPFPSSTTLVAQAFLAEVVTSSDAAVQRAVEKVLAEHHQADLKETSFYRTLPRLEQAGHAGGGRAEQFLRIEPQQSVFPEALEALMGRAKDGKSLRPLLQAVKELRTSAAKAGIEPPDTQLAVVCVDGDNMGKLLLGDASVIGAKWRDVIHPSVVKILEGDALGRLGWRALLDEKRLMGPSVHAFISHALSDFSHHVVPWVVEREFSGRLIYAGGDDVLALVPAADALPVVRRLNELYTSAWYIDHRPEATPDVLRGRVGGAAPAMDASVETERRFTSLKGEEPKLNLTGSDRVRAGLGAGCTLSASIVYGHYKSPLAAMLHSGDALLKRVSKDKMDRGSVALSYWSRNGQKALAAAVLPVKSADKKKEETPLRRATSEDYETVRRGFLDGDLASKLPYKLRELAPLALEADQVEAVRTESLTARERLVRGWVANEVPKVSRSSKKDLRGAVERLWLAGFALHVDGKEQTTDVLAQRSVEPLLLCRYLAGEGGDA